MATDHQWHFFRAGGFDQVNLHCGHDLAHLDQLDPKLWAALACPVQGLEFDTRTLQLMDTDGDGRLRVPEIIAAAKWTCSCLKNPDELFRANGALPLGAINDQTEDGKRLLSSAKQILRDLGKPDATSITVEDTVDTVRLFAQTKFNGDGIVTADAAEDDFTRSVIQAIIDCYGAETDRSGKPGINEAKLNQFFADAKAHLAWWAKGVGDRHVLPLGDGTPAAAALVQRLRPKIDDYFARCRLASYDVRAVGVINRAESDYAAFAAKDLALNIPELSGFPLARVEPSRPLPLLEGVNPAWADMLRQFHQAVVEPLLGKRTVLTETEWLQIQAKLAPYEQWSTSKAGGAVEKLGRSRLEEILNSNARETIAALLAKDRALEPEFNAITAVERLVRYYRDLVPLLKNFVSFEHFYARKTPAIFQAGTLYLDQRACELCLRVDDPAKHGVLAGFSRFYLAYCDCVRKGTGEKMTIVAAFTNGDSDNLIVGRNGVFFDRKGRDWDATITKIVDNPISIRQAFFAPYKKFLRFVEEQIAKRAAAAEAASEQRLAAAAEATAKADQTKTPPTPRKIDVGTVAAIGVAVGGITAAFGALLQVFFGLGIWMPLGILALILVISGPSMVIAWLKLRQRNLGPLLDANGWAVNAKAKVSMPLGASLTRLAKLPPGAHRDLTDPYAERNTGRNIVLALAVVIILLLASWYLGWLQKVFRGLPGSPRAEPAPAATTDTPPPPASPN
ncbi:MAG: hypothetical protein N3A53_00150 [Verrucomicrobiae bacterium]|nr:hypothetical protein [Verrucomicrobiae bacterium]